jgi:hypothetical protein
MPTNKGSKIAASQARAKTAAKKKAHSTGPVIAAAAYDALAVDGDSPESDGEVTGVIAESDSAAHVVAVAPTPRRIGRAASRRERQALTVMSAGSLRREVAMVGVVTALAGVLLAVLKLATDLGR